MYEKIFTNAQRHLQHQRQGIMRSALRVGYKEMYVSFAPTVWMY